MSRGADDAQARYGPGPPPKRSTPAERSSWSAGAAPGQLTPCAAGGTGSRMLPSPRQPGHTVSTLPVMAPSEREVEKGEFVTTSFVGERGAKGYVFHSPTSTTWRSWISAMAMLQS